MGKNANGKFAAGEATVSERLGAVERGEEGAWERLIEAVYLDLKQIAHRQMARIAPGQSLCTTALVHEAFVKLAVQQQMPVSERAGFYALCARAMRNIVIDHYRKRSADKRDDEIARQWGEFDAGRANPEAENALDALGRALSGLVERDPRMVEVFEMRYFAGLSEADISRRLNISLRSVQRIAARARAWVVAAMEP